MLKKLRRSIESLLPVSRGRKGRCRMCGACCRLPIRCFFLSKKDKCIIYRIRPLQCRKYPRSLRDKKEVGKCGFKWKEND